MKREYRPVGLVRGRTGPHGASCTAHCSMGARLLITSENFLREPNGSDKDVDWIRQKGRLVAFDEVAQPCQRECSRNQQQGDNPVPPDND